ncbi:MAG: L-serine ammonia-lyase, iron-sulfur-dependent subunit beta [Oscillospiraceae bacterium]
MNIFDIMGPIMVGPSSSHTAGAVRIGQITRRLLGDVPASARILLHGSFASTGAGHGTHQAIIAGLLGMNPDDLRIPESFSIAREAGFTFSFGVCRLKNVHPNSAVIEARGLSGGRVSVGASSLGGGRINVFELDGLKVDFTGTMPTLIVHNADRPGFVSRISGAIASHGLNVASLRLERDTRGGRALMVIECDQPIPKELMTELRGLEGIYKVTRIAPEEALL